MSNIDNIELIKKFLESTFCDIVIYGFPIDYINAFGSNVTKEFENIFKFYDPNVKIFGYYPSINIINEFQGYFLGFGTNLSLESRQKIVNDIHNVKFIFNGQHIIASGMVLNPVITHEQITTFYAKYNDILQTDTHYFLTFKNKYEIQENNNKIINDVITKINEIMVNNIQAVVNEKNQLGGINNQLNIYLQNNSKHIDKLERDNEKLRGIIDRQRIDNRTDLIGFRSKINDELKRNNILQDENVRLREYIKELKSNDFIENNYILELRDKLIMENIPSNYVIKKINPDKIPEYMLTYRWYFLDEQNKIQGPFSTIDMRAWYEDGYFANVKIRYENQYERAATFRLLHEIWGNLGDPFIERPKNTYQYFNYQNGNYQNSNMNFSATNYNHQNHQILNNNNKFSLLGEIPQGRCRRRRPRRNNRNNSNNLIENGSILKSEEIIDEEVQKVRQKINYNVCTKEELQLSDDEKNNNPDNKSLNTEKIIENNNNKKYELIETEQYDVMENNTEDNNTEDTIKSKETVIDTIKEYTKSLFY